MVLSFLEHKKNGAPSPPPPPLPNDRGQLEIQAYNNCKLRCRCFGLFAGFVVLFPALFICLSVMKFGVFTSNKKTNISDKLLIHANYITQENMSF